MRPFWLSLVMPRKMQGVEFIQTTKPDLLFRDVSLFTDTVSSAAQAPGVIHQAIAAAYAGQGVAHLTLPQDVIAAKAAANDDDVAEITRRIDQADSVVIMCGGGCHGAADVLRTLSDRLKAPLIHSVKGKDIMPYDDPRWMGGIGMIGTKAVYNAVMNCDLLLMVGTDYPYPNFLPSKGSVVQIDERPHVLGRRTPTLLGVAGSARATLVSVLDRVATKNDTRFWDKITQKRQKWDRMLDKQADPSRSKDHIHPQAVARVVSDLANYPPSTPVSTRSGPPKWIRQSGSQRMIGPFNNAVSGRRSVRPTGCRPSIARARLSLYAVMADSIC
jgi:thiamine pyrophosphate-dependent acetolactate synthase large subunit-like protein